jgi:hypothetical protein
VHLIQVQKTALGYTYWAGGPVLDAMVLETAVGKLLRNRGVCLEKVAILILMREQSEAKRAGYWGQHRAYLYRESDLHE